MNAAAAAANETNALYTAVMQQLETVPSYELDISFVPDVEALRAALAWDNITVYIRDFKFVAVR